MNVVVKNHIRDHRFIYLWEEVGYEKRWIKNCASAAGHDTIYQAGRFMKVTPPTVE